ncbi:MAG: hypothetical protein BWY59_00019 [Verrucomicrobia bacterium ADurb.Bin345]|nr:MAG: hypothetical protein BWY59_00019 [Verrucomicrobia bacterium ADurb.Bin345]
MMSLRVIASIKALVSAWMVRVSSLNAPCLISPLGERAWSRFDMTSRTPVLALKSTTERTLATERHACSTAP